MNSIRRSIRVRYGLIAAAFSFMILFGMYLYYAYSAKGIPLSLKHFMTEAIALLLAVGFFVEVVKFTVRLKKLEQEIISIDTLTLLPIKQRHKLEAEEILRKYSDKYKYAYMTFDVNNFKYINDMFGYEYGNVVLTHIGASVRRAIRNHESGTRSSSDDFSMLLAYTTEEELKDRIDYFFEETEKTPVVEGKPRCKMSFTCGVYLIQGGETINQIRANANIARKATEKRYKTTIQYYDEALHVKRLNEKEMEYDMYQALDNGDFLVYLQPKYEITSGKMTGAEALIRWKHSKKGLLSPAAFVGLFEDNGFIKQIDFYVLDTVCRHIRKWLNYGIEPIKVSVNLSRLHIQDDDLVDKITEITMKYNVPHKYIEFELTETAILEEMDVLLRAMTALKEAGFSIAMDDFGTGYSSLNLLRKLPVDVLKLDKEFFDATGWDTEVKDKQIIHHIIAMAKDLKIGVLAEGVETKEQMEFLRECNCDQIQGYFYSKPMPLNEFEEKNVLTV